MPGVKEAVAVKVEEASICTEHEERACFLREFSRVESEYGEAGKLGGSMSAILRSRLSG